MAAVTCFFPFSTPFFVKEKEHNPYLAHCAFLPQNKQAMGAIMRKAHLSLASAKYTAGEFGYNSLA